jgi:hypothetical protein
VAIVRESWDSAWGNSSNFTIPKPTGVTTGDFLLIICCNDKATATHEMQIYESGSLDTDWTKIAEYGDSSSDAHVAAFWKISDGADGTPTVYQGASSYDCVGWFFRFSGVHSTSPIDAYTGNQSTTSASSFNMASLSHSAETYGVAASAWDGGDVRPLTMTGSGWSELEELGVNDTTTVGGNVGTSTDSSSLGPNVATDGTSDGWAYIKVWLAVGGIDIDNLSGVDGGNIVQISDVDVGDIVKFSGVPF